MMRWLGPRKAPEPPDGPPHIPSLLEEDEEVTDDPLAALDSTSHKSRGQKQIYSVSRSVYLPRITLKNLNASAKAANGLGVNPLFRDAINQPISQHHEPKSFEKTRRSPTSGEKSSSSGYGGSHHSGSLDQPFLDHPQDKKSLRDDGVTILEQNQSFVKSIKVPPTSNSRTKNYKSVPSSGSSGGGTLTTIPEGRVDLPIPKPIWPRFPDNRTKINYDSIVDDAILLYTSLNYVPSSSLEGKADDKLEVSVKEILVELLHNINATMEGGTGLTAEEMLKIVNDKITSSIEALKLSTEEEMKKLCVNLSNCRRINSVLRAFGNSNNSSSGTCTSRSSPEWSSSPKGNRVRTLSSDNEDLYQMPGSGSSSSGFSDCLVNANSKDATVLPIFFNHDELLGSVPNGLRNAMIYGTLSRTKIGQNPKIPGKPKRNSLRASSDEKPSVWEQYYGVKAVEEPGDVKYSGKPTDVPLFPGGRPEADFTLDVPRSEMLLKKMKEDKKWRCRCRLLTSFLGIVFFLLSVMAVSLMLTRGKRMFGSMM